MKKKMPFKIRKKTTVPRTASSQYGSSPSQRATKGKVYKLKRSRGNLPVLVDMIIYRKPQKIYTSVIRIRI